MIRLNINRSINNGMWVVGKIGKDERVGILHDLNLMGQSCSFHVVDNNGVTTGIYSDYRLDNLRQAKYKEIPKARQPANELAARKMGYN